MHGDAELQALLTGLFAALERSAGEAEAVFSVGREAGGGTPWHVRVDGQLMMGCDQVGEALHGLMVHVTQRVVRARDDLLSIHAAGVAKSGAAVVLPGASGSGKTTLCARLLQGGADYLSDDSLAFDRQARLIGYPKALGFKVGTWVQFSDVGLADLDVDRGRQLVWQVPPSRLGASSVTSAEPVAVVVPRFEPHAALRLEPLPRHLAAAELLTQVQNLLAFGPAEALEIVGRLTARVSCHSVAYGDSREAAPAVLDLVGMADGAVAPYEVIPADGRSGPVGQPFPAADVAALCFEDGAILVRTASGEFATVDRTGALVWPLLDGHRTLESISAELAPLFAAHPSEIEADLSRWIVDLAHRGFLVLPPG
ncbi:MAG: PqqD family peptide modification chaperone [Actinomycetota bacterium]